MNIYEENDNGNKHINNESKMNKITTKTTSEMKKENVNTEHYILYGHE